MIALKPVDLVVVSSWRNSDKAGAIFDYPLGHIRDRLIKEAIVPASDVDTAIEEYRKYMLLLALGNRHLAMCSPIVDEVWHNHILFTQDYANFCLSALGSFVHHMPATATTPISHESVDRFYQSYAETFGPIPSIWGQSYFPCFMKDACGGIPQGCGDCGGKCVNEDDKNSNK